MHAFSILFSYFLATDGTVHSFLTSFVFEVSLGRAAFSRLCFVDFVFEVVFSVLSKFLFVEICFVEFCFW